MRQKKASGNYRNITGLINYYSTFLSTLHNIRAPLNELPKKDIKLNWNPKCEKGFRKPKDMPTSDKLLSDDKQIPLIIMAADASNYGVGAVISHVFPDGSEKEVAQTFSSSYYNREERQPD
ncbi:unnamed protein product [Hymenolepis diminuta]|uniref:RT_RNaseH_2 domain-containing protein n=1 Tax=Hymenolepis diminuta TaxID=6216 RepID=A0A0R3SSI3_HYMDI|nr:unnamed protein product [Hymenolepis diminuta]